MKHIARWFAIALIVAILVGVMVGLFAVAMTDPLTTIKPMSARPAACWRAV